MTQEMSFRSLFMAARRHGASDIHVLGGMPPFLRIDGEIVACKGDAVSGAAMRSMIDEVLSPAQRARLEAEWQLCFSLTFDEMQRARVSVYYRAGNPEFSIRLTEPAVRTRQQLGLPSTIDDLARKRNGLILITGPTGTGKTTTFNYMVDLVNSERRAKVVTLEDPIEFTHASKRAIVVQLEAVSDFLEFPGALRHVLRQDPDVIGVGEMRDPETIHTALAAAETGHLVIATLHTPSACGVVQRMISAFPAGRQEEIRFMLSDTLQGVVAQQLLPRATSAGRVLCSEILIGTPAVRNNIRDGKLHQLYSEIQSGAKYGMVTFDHSVLDLYQRGEITYDTALSHSRYPEGVKKRAG
jgi:twitching motility protein PilT